MLPLTLADLRAALIDRCQLDPASPRAAAAVMNPIINEAITRFGIAEPNGWPWDFAESDWMPLTAASSDPFVWASGSFPPRVRYILLSNVDATWVYPLERISRDAQLNLYPRDSERRVPQTFAMMGFDLGTEPGVAAFFRPLPDVDYRINIGGYQPMPALVADSDPDPEADRQIDDWNDTMLEYAASLVYRSHNDLSEAVAASSTFDADILSLRRWARRNVGPGITGHPMTAGLDAP